jgi:hypothetical protein
MNADMWAHAHIWAFYLHHIPVNFTTDSLYYKNKLLFMMVLQVVSILRQIGIVSATILRLVEL